LVRRLQFLADWIAVDVISFAVMRNHIHLLLAIRPDVVAGWTDREVAERRVSAMPNRRWRARHGIAADAPPSAEEVNAILHCPRRLMNARRDLSSLGFFHRLLKEPCARIWNKVDGVTGHFWEGRFKSPRVLDLEALVTVASYIELNQVHAGVAPSIPRCSWTSCGVHWRRVVALISEIRDHQGADATPEYIANRVAKERWTPVFPCRTHQLSAPGADPRSDGIEDDSGAGRTGASWSGTALGFRRCEIPLAAYLDYIHIIGQRTHPRKAGRIAPSRAGPLAEAFAAVSRDVRAFPSSSVDIGADEASCHTAAVFERALRLELLERRSSIEARDSPLRTVAFARSRGTCYGEEDAVRIEADRRGRDRLWVGYVPSGGNAA
jgi:REP element-mobilizing transposase RayT